MKEWTSQRLDELGTVERGRSRHRPRNDPSLYGAAMPFFQTGDVKAAVLHLRRPQQWYSDLGVAQSRVWEPGITCITIAANIADTAVLGTRGCFPDSVLGFTPSAQPEDSYFVKYLLDAHRERLGSAARGTTQDNLSLEKLLSFRFPVPDANGRRVIANMLRSIDELIENNKRRIDALEEIARGIYRDWFVKFHYPGRGDSPLVHSDLGPIPGGWTWAKVDDLVHIVKDSVDPAQVEPGTPAVGLEHIPRQQLTLDSWGAASDQGSRKAVFARGDVLFGKIRPYFHKVCVTPVDGICSTDAIIIRPTPVHWGELVCVISSQEFVTHATQTSNGTKMPRADWKVIGQWPIALPPVRVAEEFTRIVRSHLLLAETLMFESRSLTSLRDTLLPKLVKGQIDVSTMDIARLLDGAVA